MLSTREPRLTTCTEQPKTSALHGTGTVHDPDRGLVGIDHDPLTGLEEKALSTTHDSETQSHTPAAMSSMFDLAGAKQ